MKRVVVVGLVILAIINLLVLGVFISRNRKSVGSGSSDFLMAVTQPVYSVIGSVETVENEQLTISVLLASGKKTDIMLTVPVTNTTSIFRQVSPNANNAPRPLTANSGLTLSDIKAGDIVSVTSTEDLRSIKESRVTAQSIEIGSPVKTLMGTITGVSGNVITMQGTVRSPFAQMAMPLSPSGETYEVTIVSSTEINQQQANTDPTVNVEPKKLSISDLKVDQYVTVYYQDVNGTREAAEVVVPPTPVAVPSSSSAPPASASQQLALPTPNNNVETSVAPTNSPSE